MKWKNYSYMFKTKKNIKMRLGNKIVYFKSKFYILILGELKIFIKLYLVCVILWMVFWCYILDILIGYERLINIGLLKFKVIKGKKFCFFKMGNYKR